MVDQSQLKNLLAKQDYARLEKVIICLACDVDIPKEVKTIREIASTAGLRAATKWNISQILANAPGLAVRVPEGWQLTNDGKKRVYDLVGPFGASPSPVIASTLRQHIPKLKSKDTKSFIEEAVECFEYRKYRAAVVLSWVGAVSVLQNYVIAHCLSAFNSEAQRRDAKWRNAKNADDLSRLKESDFLNILVALSVLGKNVKQELETCLTLRNACGHPNSLKIGEARVSSHLEILILNVFEKFA